MLFKNTYHLWKKMLKTLSHWNICTSYILTSVRIWPIVVKRKHCTMKPILTLFMISVVSIKVQYHITLSLKETQFHIQCKYSRSIYLLSIFAKDALKNISLTSGFAIRGARHFIFVFKILLNGTSAHKDTMQLQNHFDFDIKGFHMHM